MLTQLATLKTRLGIDESDVQFDAILTNTLLALSRRFDNVCNRTLARTVNATHEFDASDLEIIPSIYPLESISKFETKESETDGWLETSDVGYLIRGSCIITLSEALADSRQLARITYTGGFGPARPPPPPRQAPPPPPN